MAAGAATQALASQDATGCSQSTLPLSTGVEGAGNNSGCGLRALSAEDKGRIGQLIKVLDQERRDKESARQKLRDQDAKLRDLEREREAGRVQERELLSRVSRSLHLLRQYQTEVTAMHLGTQRHTRDAGSEPEPVALPSVRAPSLVRLEPAASSTKLPSPLHEQPRSSPPPKAAASTSTTITAKGESALTPQATVEASFAAAHAQDRAQTGRHCGNYEAPRYAPTPTGAVPALHGRDTGSPPSAVRASIAADTQNRGQTRSHCGSPEPPRISSPSVDAVPVLSEEDIGSPPSVGDAGFAVMEGSDRTSRKHRFAVDASPPSSPASSFFEQPRPILPLAQSMPHAPSPRSAANVSAAIGNAAHTGERQKLTALGVLKPPQLSLLQRYLHIQQGEGSASARAVAASMAAQPEDQHLFGSPGRPTVAGSHAGSTGDDIRAPMLVVTPVVDDSAELPCKPPAPALVPQPALSVPALCAQRTQTRAKMLPPETWHEEMIGMRQADDRSMAVRSPTSAFVQSARPGLVENNLPVPPANSAYREHRDDQFTASTRPGRLQIDRSVGSDCDIVRCSSESFAIAQGLASPRGYVRSRSPSPLRRNATPTRPSPSQSIHASPQRATPLATDPQSPALATKSPASLPRASLRRNGSVTNSVATNRSSWPASIHDGYYAPAMFDVLDSVESALTQGTSSLGSASFSSSLPQPQRAARGVDTSELARLQRVLTELEHRVFGEGPPQLHSSPRAVGRSADPLPPSSAFAFAHGVATAPATSHAGVQGYEDMVLSRSSADAAAWKTDKAAAPWTSASASALSAAEPPADVVPSTPPRRSREFDLGGLWAEATSTSKEVPRRAARAPDAAVPPQGLEEIDDVVALLRKAPPEAAPAAPVRTR